MVFDAGRAAREKGCNILRVKIRNTSFELCSRNDLRRLMTGRPMRVSLLAKALGLDHNLSKLAEEGQRMIPETVKAAVVEKFSAPLSIREEPGPGEVLLELIASGVWHTDFTRPMVTGPKTNTPFHART